MLPSSTIDEIVRTVASKKLPPESVDHVASSDSTDSEGHDAVRIVIYLNPNRLQDVDGDAVLDTLLGIQSQLSAAGEDRFPLVEYASIDDIEPDGDSES
jgi:hypothetical protein